MPSHARTRAALLTVQLLFGVNYLVSKSVLSVIDAAAWSAMRAGAAFVILAALAVIRPAQAATGARSRRRSPSAASSASR